jgi:hypothetical protein
LAIIPGEGQIWLGFSKVCLKIVERILLHILLSFLHDILDVRMEGLRLLEYLDLFIFADSVPHLLLDNVLGLIRELC